MLTREQLIQRWKSWMNRHRSFSKPEMEELESHLWVEMDEMVASEGCTEEEAFARSVVNIGSVDHVYPEFEKNQPFLKKIENWIKVKAIPIFFCFFLIVIFLIADNVFSLHHTIETFAKIPGSEYLVALEKSNQTNLVDSTDYFHPEVNEFIHKLSGFANTEHYSIHFFLNEKSQLYISDKTNTPLFIGPIEPIEKKKATTSVKFIVPRIVTTTDKDDIFNDSVDEQNGINIGKLLNYGYAFFDSAGQLWIDPDFEHKRFDILGRALIKRSTVLFQLIPRCENAFKSINHDALFEPTYFKLSYYHDSNKDEHYFYLESVEKVQKPLHIIQYLIKHVKKRNLLKQCTDNTLWR